MREHAQTLGITPEEWARDTLHAAFQEKTTPNVSEITTRVFARRKSAYEKLAEGAP